ncbi:hypothetical protein R1flu_028786 [Riccia fluitans]|uniref:Uncharacterized protein n=1 Tax=Riccia fluitans TaxID=41844 RepID=A0ABD1XRQ7_9MARC
MGNASRDQQRGHKQNLLKHSGSIALKNQIRRNSIRASVADEDSYLESMQAKYSDAKLRIFSIFLVGINERIQEERPWDKMELKHHSQEANKTGEGIQLNLTMQDLGCRRLNHLVYHSKSTLMLALGNATNPDALRSAAEATLAVEPFDISRILECI